MAENLKPASEAELAEIVASTSEPLEIIGTGTKRGLGRPVQAARTLDMSAFSDIIAYEPEELILDVGAGTKLSDVETLIAARGQQLAFEPPDFSGLWQSEHSGTVGGLIACNLSGPGASRRVRRATTSSASARVTGNGLVFKAGARVVKNVTGYDMPKLATGSFGTLAALTSIILKVLPKPETEETVVLAGLDDTQAVSAMSLAMQSACEVSGAAHVPGEAVYLRLEGIAPSVAYRRDQLAKTLNRPIEILAAKSSAAKWKAHPRCDRFREPARAPAVAALGHTVGGPAHRPQHRRGSRHPLSLRLGRRSRVAGSSGFGGCVRRAHPGRAGRRPCDAVPRARAAAGRRRCVPAAACAAGRSLGTREVLVRPPPSLQSRPHVSGSLMQTTFTADQLEQPRIAEANTILRKCVHCGFCTATCPTYVLLGDELDSPRGRIYLIKNMLESGEPATTQTVKHIDRCLSCLSCMTTCPSGVHYMHLIDEARAHVEETYKRPLFERLLRNVLAYTMPRPKLFRLSLIAAKIASPLAPVAKSFGATRIAALLGLVPKVMPAPERFGAPGTYPARGPRRAAWRC